jgi:uncharacterized integral membrane protein
MTGQVQCPNCGGYKVSTETATITFDRKSGKAIEGGGILFLLLVLAAGGGLALVMFIYVAKDFGPLMIFVLGLTVPGELILIGWFIRALLRYLKADKINKEKYYHTCLLCGYEWKRWEDEPLPPVTVRPDLIVKGDQKLEEEREEERRRRDAGGMFYPPPWKK